MYTELDIGALTVLVVLIAYSFVGIEVTTGLLMFTAISVAVLMPLFNKFNSVKHDG